MDENDIDESRDSEAYQILADGLDYESRRILDEAHDRRFYNFGARHGAPGRAFTSRIMQEARGRFRLARDALVDLHRTYITGRTRVENPRFHRPQPVAPQFVHNLEEFNGPREPTFDELRARAEEARRAREEQIMEYQREHPDWPTYDVFLTRKADDIAKRFIADALERERVQEEREAREAEARDARIAAGTDEPVRILTAEEREAQERVMMTNIPSEADDAVERQRRGGMALGVEWTLDAARRAAEEHEARWAERRRIREEEENERRRRIREEEEHERRRGHKREVFYEDEEEEDRERRRRHIREVFGDDEEEADEAPGRPWHEEEEEVNVDDLPDLEADMSDSDEEEEVNVDDEEEADEEEDQMFGALFDHDDEGNPQFIRGYRDLEERIIRSEDIFRGLLDGHHLGTGGWQEYIYWLIQHDNNTAPDLDEGVPIDDNPILTNLVEYANWYDEKYYIKPREEREKAERAREEREAREAKRRRHERKVRAANLIRQAAAHAYYRPPMGSIPGGPGYERAIANFPREAEMIRRLHHPEPVGRRMALDVQTRRLFGPPPIRLETQLGRRSREGSDWAEGVVKRSRK